MCHKIFERIYVINPTNLRQYCDECKIKRNRLRSKQFYMHKIKKLEPHKQIIKTYGKDDAKLGWDEASQLL